MAHTTATSDMLLELARLENRRLEATDGINPDRSSGTLVAEYNAEYGTLGQAEALRIGADHPRFRTQYLLETLSSAARLFSDPQPSQEARDPQPSQEARIPQVSEENRNHQSVVLDERQPTQSLASESARDPSIVQPAPRNLEGGGPRHSSAHPFAFTAVNKSDSGARRRAPLSASRPQVRSTTKSSPSPALRSRS